MKIMKVAHRHNMTLRTYIIFWVYTDAVLIEAVPSGSGNISIPPSRTKKIYVKDISITWSVYLSISKEQMYDLTIYLNPAYL